MPSFFVVVLLSFLLASLFLFIVDHSCPVALGQKNKTPFRSYSVGGLCLGLIFLRVETYPLPCATGVF